MVAGGKARASMPNAVDRTREPAFNSMRFSQRLKAYSPWVSVGGGVLAMYRKSESVPARLYAFKSVWLLRSYCWGNRMLNPSLARQLIDAEYLVCQGHGAR